MVGHALDFAFFIFFYSHVQVLKPSVYYSIIAEIKFYDEKGKKMRHSLKTIENRRRPQGYIFNLNS